VATTLVAVVALAAHQLATPWQPAIVLAAVSHQLMWTAPVAVLLALAARRRATLAVALLSAMLVLAVEVPPRLGSTPAAEGAPMTVLQANLRVGSAEPAALVSQVRRQQVVVLATDELTIAEQQRLVGAGLARLLPYRFTAPLAEGGGGLGIWSRYPLADGQNLPGYELGVLSARVAVPGGAVTFVAVHLLPPYPYPSHIWRTEIRRLKGFLDRQPTGPAVLVAGDFNATTDHAQFRALLTHGYTDAAEQVGAGYLPTYPDDRWYGPVLGIDHVLVRGRATATSVRTLGLPGSDHRGLLVGLVLAG
jgi:endonuclease/exonuclease/phosphatase (EEP) superfamily protein YafD